MRLRHRRALGGLAHLDDDDGLAGARRVVGGELEGAAVLEPLDVAGDHAHLVLVGEVAGEVGELEVDLVAGRRPVRQLHPEVLRLEDRPSLVPGLGDEGDGRPGQVVAERLEGVEVRVRPEQVRGAAVDELLQAPLELGARRARLGEAGGEDDGEGGTLLEDGLVHADRVTDEDDRQVDVVVDVEDRVGARVAVDRVVLGMDRVEGGARRLAPRLDLAPHRRVGLAPGVRGTDDGDGLGVQEAVEVHVAQPDRPAGGVEGERCVAGHGGEPT